MVLKKPIFDSYLFRSSTFTNSASQRSFCHSEFSSPKISTTHKSSISVSPTNRNNFFYSIPSVIKFNDSKSACAPSQTSHLLPFSIKSSKRLFQSSTQACEALFSQNKKVLNSGSLFQVSELPLQRNTKVTLPFTVIPLRSSAICIFFIFFLVFNFILLTCPYCFILNFNILLSIYLTF